MVHPELISAIASAQQRLENGGRLASRFLEHAEGLTLRKQALAAELAKVIVDRVRQQPSIVSSIIQDEIVDLTGRTGRIPPAVRRQVVSAAAAGRQTPPIKTQEVELPVESQKKYTVPIELVCVFEARPSLRSDPTLFRDRVLMLTALLQLKPEDLTNALENADIAVGEVRKKVIVLQIGINGCNRLELDVSNGVENTVIQYAEALQQTITSMPNSTQNPHDLERDLVTEEAMRVESDTISIPIIYQETASRHVLRTPSQEEDIPEFQRQTSFVVMEHGRLNSSSYPQFARIRLVPRNQHGRRRRGGK